MSAAWSGTWENLLDADIVPALVESHWVRRREEPSKAHRKAWADSVATLRTAGAALTRAGHPLARWTLAFEYELAWEGGRRPDVVALGPCSVTVLEFKGDPRTHPAHLAQVSAYSRDLEDYHSGTHGRRARPVLVHPTRKRSETRDGVRVVGPPGLARFLGQAEREDAGAAPIDAARWLLAPYEPLPGVLDAARRVFYGQPLPQIRRAASGKLPRIAGRMAEITRMAEGDGEYHLVLVTGVPGSGKTLAGLQYVYDHGGEGRACYLTGNGPLTLVLQKALESKALVRPIRNFFLEYPPQGGKVPREHLFAFDEAQRAWDAERMGENYDIAVTSAESVVGAADRVPRGAVVFALLGEGQEIHLGEEAGPGQWVAAVRSAKHPWHVHAPPKMAGLFAGLPRVSADPMWDLDESLRGHRAVAVSEWAAALLGGDLNGAGRIADDLRAGGFRLDLSRDLDEAKRFLRERYADETSKFYGMVCSSRAKNLERHGVPNGFMATSKLNYAAWYVGPPLSPKGCRALERAVTEFGCQGLELDTPLVCWGDDLLWDGAGWKIRPGQKGACDPVRLRLNSYRVLLTRGRDGLMLFCPPDEAMDATAGALLTAGFTEL